MSTTTLTSFSTSKAQSKELCSLCGTTPYDLICTCGDKFDFNCIQHHVEHIGMEFQDEYQKATEHIEQLNGLKFKENNNTGATRTLIENWKRKRIEDINEIAERALNDNYRQENIFQDVESFQQTYSQLSTELHRIGHDNLNNVIQLNRNMKDKIENFQNVPEILNDDASLDALLRSKLNPSSLSSLPSTPASTYTNHSSETIEREPIARFQSYTRPELRRDPSRTESAGSTSLTESKIELNPPEPTISYERIEPKTELTTTNDVTVELTETNETTPELTNTNDPINDYSSNDEFDAGFTRHIQRQNPAIITVNNDKHAATVCCHNNQLLYNEFDRTTQNSRLIFINNINNPTVKQTINWSVPDTTTNADDDEWIQDIIYSDKISGYLVLNRVRIRVFQGNTNELDDFYTFTDRTTKRISCNNKYIYVVSTPSITSNNGDEITLLNYDPNEELCKTFRDIIPSRINRGAAQSIGEITDIGVSSNDQVAIGYRLERRREVGICVFNVTNDGKEWSSVKQLLLNDCWHNDVAYTPRMDWCERLNSFILIEYITGHLIMVDKDGQVQGECRFMHPGNRRDSPINLTISTNGNLCVRYESLIYVMRLFA